MCFLESEDKSKGSGECVKGKGRGGGIEKLKKCEMKEDGTEDGTEDEMNGED